MANSVAYQNPFNIEGALQLWEGLLAGKSASTIDCYLRDVRQVADALHLLTGARPAPQDIMALETTGLDRLVEHWSGDAPATVRRRLVSLRRFGLMLAASLGMTGPLLHCRFPILEVPPTDPVPAGDLAELTRSMAGENDWTSCRDRAMLALVFERGLSTGELHRLDRAHLIANLLVVTSATGGLRFIELSPGAADAVRTYVAAMHFPPGENGPLWLNRNGGRMSPRSIQLMLRRRRITAELPDHVVAGSFRKRRILELAASGMGVDGIAAEIGIGKAAVLAHLPGS